MANKLTDNVNATPWFDPRTLTKKKLESWTITELLIMAKRKKGFKKALIDFINP